MLHLKAEVDYHFSRSWCYLKCFTGKWGFLLKMLLQQSCVGRGKALGGTVGSVCSPRKWILVWCVLQKETCDLWGLTGFLPTEDNEQDHEKKPYFRHSPRKTAFPLVNHMYFITNVYFCCFEMYCQSPQASIYWWKCCILSVFIYFSTFCFRKPSHKNPYLSHWQF